MKYFRGLDQRKRKLESLLREDDQDAVMAKLIDEAANLNTRRLQCAIDIKVKLVLNQADVHMKSWSPPVFSLPWQNVLQHLTEFTRRGGCLQMEFCWKTYDLHWVWCEGISIGQVVIGLIIFSQKLSLNTKDYLTAEDITVSCHHLFECFLMHCKFSYGKWIMLSVWCLWFKTILIFARDFFWWIFN